MKRMWLGIGLLVLFLVIGLWGSYAMTRQHEPLADQLQRAADLAVAGDLPAALQLAEAAQKSWDSHWHATATLADHNPMDEIDAHFARLPVYAEMSHQADFAACCTQLAALISATAEAHTFSWWNIL